MSFTLEATVNMDEVTARIERNMSQIRAGANLILAEMATHGFHFMQSIAPYRTGRLRGSIRTKIGDMCAEVGPTVDYAPYLEYGTRPSPGRYVPAIGKRLVDASLPYFGMHPGIRGRHFVERTREEMETYGHRVAEGILGRMIS